MGEETWIETAEKITLFRNQGKGAEAARLLEISNTNRILVDREQAIIQITLRLVHSRFKGYYPDNKSSYGWLNELLDMVEEHQLTIDGKSREQFMKVAIAQYQGGKNQAQKQLENVTK